MGAYCFTLVCPCVCLSVRNKLSSQFPQQLLIADAWNFRTLFLLACHIMWFIFARIRFQLPLHPCICSWSINRKFSSQFSQQLLIADAWNFRTLFLLAYHIMWFIFARIRFQLPLYPCICSWSINRKFSSQFSQQLLIADAWNFSTLFLLACHIVGLIFVQIRCQLPVYPCVCV
jgi:divalent metal cation (Fe/Co/Zn/Cd) transporter